MSDTKRRSRLKPKPKKTRKRGDNHQIRITDNDIAIFFILQRYRYLPINFIFELLPAKRNYKKFQERLTDLSGHGYLHRPEQQFDAYNAYYKKITYELGKKGKEQLALLGENLEISIGVGNSYHHEALTCLIIASIEIACRGYRFKHWPDILRMPKIPESTRESSTPFHLPLIGMKQKSQVPDGTPFCIVSESNLLCFPGIETDMGTEVLNGNRRVTIKRKLEGYVNITKHRTYKTHYGLPNMIVPFVTTSERRMKNMIHLLDQVTNSKGASNIIFSHTEHLRSSKDSPDPVDLLQSEWLRAGHEPFNFEEKLGQ
ncbi:MAG: hypothetical protein EX270_01625 [Pseudomonadales bacterium]|nr:MAG: hypothetical protein EX270_01625 [Pseudomonadales bacterium]